MKREHKPQYTIKRTEEFIRKSQEIRTIYKRFTEMINAIDWALQRRPHFFTNVSGEFYLLKTKELSNPDFPKLKILYRIVESESLVVLMDIEDE